jgi:molybdopterin-guanine dinucleotide biosynthesis protein A
MAESEPFWSKQLNLLRTLAPEKVMISVRFRAEWIPVDIPVVLDSLSGEGPINAIAAIAATVTTTHFMVIAVDMPLMTPAHLRKLCSFMTPVTGVCTKRQKLYEPLCAIYPSECSAVVESHIRRKQYSLQELVFDLHQMKMMQTMELTEAEALLYENLNHPEDYAKRYAPNCSRAPRAV